MTTSDNLIPIKLPAPPSLPSHPTTTSHASSSPSSSSLDAQIRWVVDSGSIVQKGERIALIVYSYGGTFSSFASAPFSADDGGGGGGGGGSLESATSVLGTTTSQRSNIRARMKKRWGSASNNNNTPSNTSSTGSNESISTDTTVSNGIALEIRAPSSGFLRVLYTKPTVFNAAQTTTSVTSNSSHSYQPLDLILAAIEPCEHPAVVGTLCAVCGADTRAATTTESGKEEKGEEEKPHVKEEMRKTLRRDHVDAQQRHVDRPSKGKKSEAKGGDISANQTMQQTTIVNTANKAATASQPASGLRSLSSLLTGAKTTQAMQQPQQRHQIPQRRNGNNPAPSSAASESTNNYASNTTDPKMTQMTVSGGITLTISEAEAKSISEASSKKLREKKQLCLVLDLDHTLLHATDDYRAGRFVADEILIDDATTAGGGDAKQNNAIRSKTAPNPQKREDVRSILLPVDLPPAQYQQYMHQKIQEQQYQLSQMQVALPLLPAQKPNSPVILRHYVKLRPHLKDFFTQIQDTYKLSVYTAGTRAYAEQIAVMICRHLAGATLDEEGLETLRRRVREKDEECRRYRDQKAKLGRRKQLELAKNRDMGMDIELALEIEKENGEGDESAPEKRTVSFEGGNDESSSAKVAKTTTFALPTKNSTTEATENVAEASASGEESELAQKVDGSLKVSANKKEATTGPSKRGSSTGNGKMHIPRKKKRVNTTGSLLPLIAPPTKPDTTKETSLEEEEAKLHDPTDERDHLRRQLEEAEKLEIAAVELRRKLFGSRIVSRTDVGDLGTDVKSLKRVFPCGGVMAAIVDDREDVWANAKNNDTGRPGEPPDNLLLVQPYHWKPFSGYRDVNNASGQDLSKSDDDKSSSEEEHADKEQDVQLLWTADILKRLHERYYSPSISLEDRDKLSVPSLLRSMRKETLLRFPQANIVFSGVIPIDKQKEERKVRVPLVRYAEELGARVLPDVTKGVTHVVARRDGSDKIHRARKEVPGCYIVQPSWLMECYWSITRRDVAPYHMGPMPKRPTQLSQRQNQLHISNVDSQNKLLLGDSDEDKESDDDDDFAADLESEMMKGP
eukprot:g6729.t1 g6729   contig23:1104868-1108098(-)